MLPPHAWTLRKLPEAHAAARALWMVKVVFVPGTPLMKKRWAPVPSSDLQGNKHIKDELVREGFTQVFVRLG